MSSTPEGDERVENPTPAISESNANNNTSRNSNNRSNVRSSNGNTTVVSSNDVSWEGTKPEIGAVLGLKAERLKYKASFEVFRQKLINYVLREFTNPKDILPAVKKFENPLDNFTLKHKPTDLTAEEKKSDVLVAIQNQKVKLLVERETCARTNLDKLYGIVKGQCSSAIISILNNDDEFEDKDEECDAIWLLTKVQEISAGLDAKANKRVNLIDSILSLSRLHQRREESEDDYMKRFKAACDTVIAAGGSNLFCSTEIMDKAGSIPTSNEIKVEEEKFKAIWYLKLSDKARHGDLMRDLQNAAYLHRDEYPTTTSEMFDVMIRRSGAFSGSANMENGSRTRSRRGYNFAQHERGGNGREETPPEDAVFVPGTDGRTMRNIRCYNCQSWGHLAPNCPVSAGRSATGLAQVSYTFNQSCNGIPSSWLLLDTCSTTSVACNKDLVKNLVMCSKDDHLTVYTNGGSKTFHEKGELKILPIMVYFNSRSMANILSLKDVVALNGVRVTMDSRKERALFVHFGNMELKFEEHAEGLYYYDTASSNNVYKSNVSDYSCLQSVHNNKLYYTTQEIKAAEHARKLQEELGWPSTTAYKKIIGNNLVANSNITIDDINRAEIIYGPASPLLKGRMTRRAPIKNRVERVPLPIPIGERHKEVHLYIDFFYINGYPFLVSKSKSINFITAEICSSRGKQQIIRAIEKIRHTYEARGFEVVGVHGDNEFDMESLKDFLLPAILHIYGKNEHVGVAERAVRTIKERCRTMTHAVPYAKIPKLMVIALVKCAVLWLNAFPSADGVSNTVSPAEIVQGRPKPDMRCKRIVYGSYAMVHSDTKNNMKARSVPSIALNPSNMHGGHYFMSLYSGKVLHSYNWEEIPINDEVIGRVEELASEEDAPRVSEGCLLFEWAPGTAVSDEIIGSQGENLQPQLVNDETAHRDEAEEIDEIGGDFEVNAIDEIFENEEENEARYVSEDDNIDLDSEVEDDVLSREYEMRNDKENDTGEIESISEEEETYEKDPSEHDESESGSPDESKEITNTRPKRSNAGKGVERLEMSFKGKEYGTVVSNTAHQFATLDYGGRHNCEVFPLDDYHRVAVNVMFTQAGEHAQMNAAQGIKKFGQEAIAAIWKEYKQLNEGAVPGKPVFGEVDPHTLTDMEKYSALEAVNLIKKKRSGVIKGRTCANGSRQRRFLKPGETVASPTVSLEALLGTLVIDVYEDRDVCIFDVPGAYLQASMPKEKKY